MTGKEIKNLVKPKLQDKGAVTGAVNFNLAAYTHFLLSIEDDITIDLQNADTPCYVILEVTHTAAGTSITNLPGRFEWDFRWAEGEEETTILGGIYNGTQWSWSKAIFQTIPPSIVSITAIDSATIVVALSRVVTATNVGWSFDNGGSITPSAISGSGTNTLTFTVSGISSGDTITGSYDATTGDTEDALGNEVVTISGVSVANEIPSVEFITWNSIDTDQEQYNSNKGIRKVSGATPAWSNPSWSNETIGDGEAVVFKMDVDGYMIFGLSSARSGNPGAVAGDWNAYFQSIAASIYYDSTGFGAVVDSGQVTSAGFYLKIARSGGNFVYSYSTDDITYNTIATLGGASGAYYVGIVIYGNVTNAGIQEIKKV